MSKDIVETLNLLEEIIKRSSLTEIEKKDVMNQIHKLWDFKHDLDSILHYFIDIQCTAEEGISFFTRWGF